MYNLKFVCHTYLCVVAFLTGVLFVCALFHHFQSLKMTVCPNSKMDREYLGSVDMAAKKSFGRYNPNEGMPFSSIPMKEGGKRIGSLGLPSHRSALVEKVEPQSEALAGLQIEPLTAHRDGLSVEILDSLGDTVWVVKGKKWVVCSRYPTKPGGDYASYLYDCEFISREKCPELNGIPEIKGFRVLWIRGTRVNKNAPVVTIRLKAVAKVSA